MANEHHPRSDIMVALQNGKPTAFFRDRFADVKRALAEKGFGFEYELDSGLCHAMDAYLGGLFTDIMGICNLVNKSTQDSILDILGFEEVFVSLCYRLLHFRPLQTRQVDSQAIWHCGLLMFVMATFFQIDRTRIMEFKLLSQYFRDILATDYYGPGNDASLWLAMVGGMWYWKNADFEWITFKIRAMVEYRGLDTWDEMKEFLHGFPWIHTLHDRTGLQLWNRIQQSSTPT